jgi:hypothetical protein
MAPHRTNTRLNSQTKREKESDRYIYIERKRVRKRVRVSERERKTERKEERKEERKRLRSTSKGNSPGPCIKLPVL